MFENKLFPKFFAAWLFAAAVTSLPLKDAPSLDDIHSVNPVTFIILLVSVFFLLSAADYKRQQLLIPEKMLCAVTLAFACVILTKTNSVYTLLPLALFFVLSMHHLQTKDRLTDKDIPKKLTIAFISAIAVIAVYTVAAISVCRYKTYSTPNFDFGIFTNMYYNMKHGFLPVSTCERDKLLSHFAVHVSPALYIFLPIYFIFPSPVTVAICQVLAIYSGIIPFILIGKKYNLDNRLLMLLSVVFAASPVLAGGCMFDFHENCLLVPFLMWMFYFYEKKKTVPMFIFVVLTLLVKEDAFIYICVFAAYIIVAKKHFKKGFMMIVVALGWFLTACFLLQRYGTGVMTNRFDAMMAGGGGLFDVIKTVLFNPAYTSKLMLETDPVGTEKLFYVLQLLFPLALMPFITKKSARLILLTPILLNLLTSYIYQYNIFFQYSFGICTLLLYTTMLNTADLKMKNRKLAARLSAGLSLMMFCMIILPQYGNYVGRYKTNTEMYKRMDAVLENIPEDKSVCATAFLVPKLSQRKEIYEAYYHEKFDTDYLIVDIRPGYFDESAAIAAKYEEHGYVLTHVESDLLMVYESPELHAREN